MKAADDDEGSLGNWIAHSKKKELGTDSERGQLLKRVEIGLRITKRKN